jgi:acyl-CoA synthetase (AMP-forming)/AMP-acid ligase II
VGIVGAIEVRGPNVFAGYWRNADKTRGEFTSDGWFKTGDLGRIDSAGYVHIVGELPRNAVGKVQKKALCAAFRSLYCPT